MSKATDQALQSEDAQEQPAQDPPAPETPLELMQRAAAHVLNTKAWALAKADSVEKRITDAGGEPSAEMAEAIAAVREAAK